MRFLLRPSLNTMSIIPDKLINEGRPASCRFNETGNLLQDLVVCIQEYPMHPDKYFFLVFPDRYHACCVIGYGQLDAHTCFFLEILC